MAETPPQNLPDLPAWARRLRSRLAEPERLDAVVAARPGRGGRRAAVLVLIADRGTGPEIVFAERAHTLRHHPGQIAFPGGAADPGDADLTATALREAWEEIGADPASVVVLGVIPAAHVAVSGFDVHAVVGWWARPGTPTVRDPAEVASVFTATVSQLTDPARRARVHHPSGYTGPAFEAGGHVVWGLTAHLLDGVLGLAGWQQPWDRNRVIEIPSRYRTDVSGGGGADAH